MKQHPLEKPCSRCGAKSWERTSRDNFLKATVLDFFGLYPWRCALCNKARLMTLRADRRQASRTR